MWNPAASPEVVQAMSVESRQPVPRIRSRTDTSTSERVKPAVAGLVSSGMGAALDALVMAVTPTVATSARAPSTAKDRRSIWLQYSDGVREPDCIRQLNA